MPVFQDLSSFANGRSAFYVGAKTLSNLAIKAFRANIRASHGNIVKLAVAPYCVKLIDVVEESSGHSARDIELKFDKDGDNIYLISTSSLLCSFEFGIFDSNQNFTKLTSIDLRLHNMRFELTVSPEYILCDPAEARREPIPVREPDFDDIISDEQLDLLEATRLEGMLTYGGLANLIAKTVDQPQRIDLSILYPSMNISGVLDTEISPRDDFLFIAGEIIRTSDSYCDCRDVGDGIGSVDPGQTSPNNGGPVGDDNEAGTIVIGRPWPVTPTTDMLGFRMPGEGDAGVLMSHEFLQQSMVSVFPAIRVDVKDNGFVGYKAAGIVDFDDVKLSIDPHYGRLILEFGFRAEVYGSIHVDLGKLGKIRVTNFSAEQQAPGVNRVKICVYTVIGSGGVFFKPVLEDLQIDDFKVYLRLGTLIGSPFGTWGAVIGYIFDEILSQLVARDIPYKLDKEMRKVMKDLMFPIIDAQYALELSGNIARHQYERLASLYQADPQGLLVSSDLRNWG